VTVPRGLSITGETIVLPSIAVRDARPEDAGVLVALWEEMSFGTGHSRFLGKPSAATARVAIERLATEPSARLMVGELNGEVCALAYLRRTPLSPLHDEDAVTVEYLHVSLEARRHGLGKALIAEAAAWADEKDSQHVAVLASANEREANRFLARLGLSQFGVVRLANAHTVRRRLAAEQSANLLGVLATRRTTLARRAALMRGTRTPFTQAPVTLPAAPESAGK
jgi:GNAT superfamily N-acetyltransferase